MAHKIAIVTGAGSGIGRASALALQKAGFSVVLIGRRPDSLDATAALADPLGGRILPIPADVSRPEDVRRAFAQTKETFGRLDLLFNNAGRGAPVIPMEDLTYEQWNVV